MFLTLQSRSCLQLTNSCLLWGHEGSLLWIDILSFLLPIGIFSRWFVGYSTFATHKYIHTSLVRRIHTCIHHLRETYIHTYITCTTHTYLHTSLLRHIHTSYTYAYITCATHTNITASLLRHINTYIHHVHNTYIQRDNVVYWKEPNGRSKFISDMTHTFMHTSLPRHTHT